MPARSSFVRDDSGGPLVEFAITIGLFLAVMFAVIDFGRAWMDWTLAEKATQIAARIAVVRPGACPAALPVAIVQRVEGSTLPYGARCNVGGLCCPMPSANDPDCAGGTQTTITCAGNTANATVAEIWARIDPLLPSTVTAANLSFTYQYTPELGFLGGPFVPMVTVELTGVPFTFVTPFSALLALYGGSGGPSGTITMPGMRTTLPGEDLALGENG